MRVRAVRDCFVDRRWKKGEEGEYSGPKNKNLEPVKVKVQEPGRAKGLTPAPTPGDETEPEPAA